MKRRLSLGDTVRQSSAIQQLLSEARVTADASRVVLYQFHNGGVFSNKQPRWYLAVAGESLAPNAGPAILGDVSTLASRCSELINRLWDAEAAPGISRCSPLLLCQTRSDLKLPIVDVAMMESGYAKACLIKAGVKKLVQAPIRDEHGICGYLSLELCDEAENLDAACKIAVPVPRRSAVRMSLGSECCCQAPARWKT